MARKYPFIVIDAPGTYGAKGSVWSRHRTLRAACAAKAKWGKGFSVAENSGDERRGDTFWSDMPPTIVSCRRKG